MKTLLKHLAVDFFGSLLLAGVLLAIMPAVVGILAGLIAFTFTARYSILMYRESKTAIEVTPDYPTITR